MHRPSPGLIALTLFFTFGATMCALTVMLLLLPGGGLEPLWRLNPQAHEAFLGMGEWAVTLMLVVGLACAFAAAGLWRLTPWGRRLALGILAVNLVGDSANAIIRGDLRTLIGLPIGGAMMAYLLSRRVSDQMVQRNSVG